MPVPSELVAARERDVVVVVEDDASHLQALVRTLARDAPEDEVIEASTAMDGLLELGRLKPNLVVLGYRPPGLNAAQAVERLLDPSRRLTWDVMEVKGGIQMEAEHQ